MVINVPKDVENIINTLYDAGFEAYAVGGCVRDSILGRTPNDWDITTSARPEQVKKLFRRTIDTGLQHGTVTIMIDKTGYEVTTYRVDGDYLDGRHPESVEFTASLEEDLKRRDFTINAMAYNNKEGLVDIFGGMDDIKRKVIKCVGNPYERFSEDALRLMRAVRFAAQLGYDIDKETFEAIGKLAPTLQKVSAERIQVELVKMLTSDNPGHIKVAYEAGLTAQFIPEFDVCMKTDQHNPHHKYSVGEHIVESVKTVEPDKVLRLAMLLHDIGKPECITTDDEGIDHFYGHPKVSAEMAVEILKRLKFDNATIQMVKKLVLNHDKRIEPGEKYMRRAICSIGEECFPKLFKVFEADISAQSDYQLADKKAKLERNRADYGMILSKGDCVSLKTLAVTGKDLIDNGVKPGPQMGSILQEMLKDVIDHPENNNKEYLLATYLLR